MGLKSKIKNFFMLDDEFVEDLEEDFKDPENEEESRPSRPQSRPNVVSLQSIQKNSKLIISEPSRFSEAPDIADHVKNRKVVIVNLQKIDPVEGRRIVDFLGGAVYALGGEIQRIGVNIFLCVPDNVEISGSISESIFGKEQDDMRWS